MSNRCPLCGQANFLVLPRYSAVSRKDAEKEYCHLKEGDNCEVCLKARIDFLDRAFGKYENNPCQRVGDSLEQETQ